MPLLDILLPEQEQQQQQNGGEHHVLIPVHHIGSDTSIVGICALATHLDAWMWNGLADADLILKRAWVLNSCLLSYDVLIGHLPVEMRGRKTERRGGRKWKTQGAKFQYA